jgi:hypothetical protein
MTKANDIFGEGNYNFALYKYALEKVCEEEAKQREEEERRIAESMPKVSILQKFKNSNLYIVISIGIAVLTIGLIASNYYNYIGGIYPSQVISK